MVDNFYTIYTKEGLLLLTAPGEFYFLTILTRRKDGECQKNRILKEFCIGSVEDLKNISEEVRALCDQFNARAYLNLSRKSYEKVAKTFLIKATKRVLENNVESLQHLYASAVNTTSAAKECKRWIIDVDYKEPECEIIEYLGDKYVCTIPTNAGYHIITKPFNLAEFKAKFPEKEDLTIHKDNGTLLYFPGK